MENKTNPYEIAVIGGGAAGSMAAIRAAQRGKRTVLIERNESLGRKIMMTGKGRCNITNAAPLDAFIKKFSPQGEFFRSAFFAFSNDDLIEFFRSGGLELKAERQGRVFPVTDRARSVVSVLEESLKENRIDVLYGRRVTGIERKDGRFVLRYDLGRNPVVRLRSPSLENHPERPSASLGTSPEFIEGRSRGKLLSSLDLARDDTEPVEVSKGFILTHEDARQIEADKVIVATGGASYKATGSTGDGFVMAERLGHKIKTLNPALVPLKVKEPWVKDLQGLALENIRVSFRYGKKKLISDVGELMFTHFGVSGPLVLDMSGDIVSAFERHKEILMAIDLKPGLRKEQLESKLVHKFAVKGNIQIKNLMQDILPKRMIIVFLSLLNVSPEKRTNQITKKERSAIVDVLKAFPLTISGSLPIEEAMVTAGGVSMKDINPRTMESKIVRGLYFAGEIIEGAAPSGGYNLQQAFSTGYLAGESAANR